MKDSYVTDKASLVPKLWVRYDSFSETYNPVLGYADCILEKIFYLWCVTSVDFYEKRTKNNYVIVFFLKPRSLGVRVFVCTDGTS